MNGFSETELHDIRTGKSENPKLDALVKLAADITQNRGNTSTENLDAFFSHGYNSENLVDLILQVSDKTALNYLHNLTQVPVDFPLAPAL
jgi:alkylhydroperoxidase family enzyme